MSSDFPDDPAATIDRRFLKSCASVSRRSPKGTDEYKGLLFAKLRIGSPLVLILDSRRRLETTAIRRIKPAPGDGVYVDTANSRYLVRWLFPAGRAVIDDLPKPAREPSPPARG